MHDKTKKAFSKKLKIFFNCFQIDSKYGTGGQILTRRRTRFDFLWFQNRREKHLAATKYSNHSMPLMPGIQRSVLFRSTDCSILTLGWTILKKDKEVFIYLNGLIWLPRIQLYPWIKHSGDLKNKHLDNGNIWITNFYLFIIQVIGCMINGLNTELLSWYSSHDLNHELKVF